MTAERVGDMALTPAAIEQANTAMRAHIRLTPVLATSGAAFGLPDFPLTLKLEQTQVTGSFKARGAFANLLLRAVPPAGVVAASGGNHGVAVAFAASRVGCPAHIFVPSVSHPAKVTRIREYGAHLTVAGERYADALASSIEWARSSEALQVHAFDQPETIIGQGTLGLELSKQAPDVDTVLVGVGGGGLLAGLAAWYRGGTKVVGVEPRLAPTLTAALAAGHPVDAPAGGIAADSLAPRQAGATGLPLIRAFVEQVLLVEDADIARAQVMLWESARIVAEPGGAAALAALLSGRYVPAAHEHVAVIICGGNTNTLPSATAVHA